LIPDEVTEFFQLTYPSSLNMTLGSTQPLIELRTRNLPGGKMRPARKSDIPTVISESIVLMMWEPRLLTPYEPSRIEDITGEINSVYGTNIRTQFSHLIYTGRVVYSFFDFCYDNESPNGRDVQAELTARMVYQRHVVGFLVFPACDVWFRPLDLTSL
jgi:hypothetical protein